MRAASLEWPFALRMARRVSTRVDMTAGSDECRSPRRRPTRLESAGLDPRRTAGSDLLGTDPSTPEPRSCLLQWSDQNHPDSWWLSDLLQYLRDQLEWREREQEAPPVVPRHIYIYKFYLIYLFYISFYKFYLFIFIWHIQTRGTISYIQHISTYIETISYTHISINIYTHDSQPVTHSFILVLSNMVHIHNFLDQYPICVWYIGLF